MATYRMSSGATVEPQDPTYRPMFYIRVFEIDTAFSNWLIRKHPEDRNASSGTWPRLLAEKKKWEEEIVPFVASRWDRWGDLAREQAVGLMKQTVKALNEDRIASPAHSFPPLSLFHEIPLSTGGSRAVIKGRVNELRGLRSLAVAHARMTERQAGRYGFTPEGWANARQF